MVPEFLAEGQTANLRASQLGTEGQEGKVETL